jgi:uncharacterized membrane protein (UPF0127 family)
MKFMTSLLIVFGVLVLGAFALSAYLLFVSSTPNPKLPTQTLKVGNAVFSVEIANTTTTRMRGLSGREPLANFEGMLFIFDSPNRYGFWMKDMKFALDFVWIRGAKVVGVTENVSPPTGASLFSLPQYYPPEDADKVLEIDAGEVAKNNIKAGDEAIVEQK